MPNEFMEQLKQASASRSDLILTTGGPAYLRNHRSVTVLNCGAVVERDEINVILKSLLSEYQWEQFTHGDEVLFPAKVDGIGRFRLYAVRKGDIDALALRPILDHYLDWANTGFPNVVAEMSDIGAGRLVLITGTISSGRTTTVARLIEGMKREEGSHVVILEKCPEYEFDVPIITRFAKKETNTDSYTAIEMINPEVVVIDEIESFEDVKAAITLAEGGAYVIAVTQGIDTQDSLKRILNYAPAQEADSIRRRFGRVFGACVSHWVAARKDSGERAIATEICIGNPAVKNIIREDKLYQITAQIQVGLKYRMRILTQSLCELVKNDVITFEEAAREQQYTEQLRIMLERTE